MRREEDAKLHQRLLVVVCRPAQRRPPRRTSPGRPSATEMIMSWGGKDGQHVPVPSQSSDVIPCRYAVFLVPCAMMERTSKGEDGMAATSDVIVIGGGMIGLSVAYALQRARLNVMLVERGVVGREASWAAAGYLSFQGDSNQPGPRLELMRVSRLLYDGWLEELAEYSAADTGFWRCGLLEVCLTDEEVRAAQERLLWQRAAGYAIEWLDAATVRARQPQLAPDLPVHGGLWLPEVAQVRPPRLLKALTEAVLRLGVQVREYAPVVGVTRRGEQVTGVTLASGEHLAAPLVVNAAGSWAAQIAPEMARLPVKPVKGTIVLLEMPAPPTRALLVTSRG
ncbi:MAG: FAD-dependent oxidoreductase, partial [Candidatus Tectomicrobia bacterium]|nr:FAD-dependent oxidoreductase [Candidatus Tectomicrobia bacterium]